MCKGMQHLILIWTLVGCHGMPSRPQLELSENKEKMRATLLTHIPVGTDISDAEAFMSKHGFECSRNRDELGKFLFCDRSVVKDDFVATRWQVVIRYDKRAATALDVFIGNVGP